MHWKHDDTYENNLNNIIKTIRSDYYLNDIETNGLLQLVNRK
jgi:hypothetical protein